MASEEQKPVHALSACAAYASNAKSTQCQLKIDAHSALVFSTCPAYHFGVVHLLIIVVNIGRDQWRPTFPFIALSDCATTVDEAISITLCVLGHFSYSRFVFNSLLPALEIVQSVTVSWCMSHG